MIKKHKKVENPCPKCSGEMVDTGLELCSVPPWHICECIKCGARPALRQRDTIFSEEAIEYALSGKFGYFLTKSEI